MKKKFLTFLMFTLSALITGLQTGYAQNVAINSTGNDPDASAMLDVQSSSKGMLIPQVSLLSLSDATTISSPAHSLLIYNNSATYVAKGYYYNSGTTGSPVWTKLAASSDLLAMSAIGATPNANAATISGGYLTLQPADATYGGILTASAQTIGGAKTFSGAISASNLSGTNTGDNAVNSLYNGLVSNANHTGDATGATVLTLATVNSNVGSFGSATQVPTYTVNGKGLITAAANTTIQIPESQVTGLVTDLGLLAPKASPTFTGTVTMPSPFTLGATSVTTTGTQLNYLNAATGTTGTTSSNLVYSTSPVFTTPRLASTSTSGYVWAATDALGNGSWQNVAGINTMAAIGATANANGASISGSTLTLQPADATYGGILTAGAQTIAGAKTFSGAISASNLSGTNTGDNATNSLYSGLVTNANHTGDATGATVLTLATVNSNVGSFGSATQVPTYTVNGKGLITAAANTTIQIPESQVTGLVTDLGLLAPKASPTFTGTVTMPSPFTLGATSVTTTGTQLNYLNAATGTTGTTSSNLVYSTSPVFTTPRLASTSTSGYVWTATDTLGNGNWQAASYSSSATNLVTVYSLADLPTPSSGAITLDANKMYIFSGIVNISPNYLNLNGAGLRGTDPAKDGVMSTVSGAILRSSGVSVFIQNLAVLPASGSTKAYDFADATKTKFCNIFSGSSVVEVGTPSLGVGQISGFLAVTIVQNFWNCKDGIKITGNMGKFCAAYDFIVGINSGGVGIEFLAGLTIDDIDLANNYFIYTGQTGVKLNAGATVDLGRMTTNMFRGVTTFLTGFDSFTPGWQMVSNTNIPDSRSYAYCYMNGNATSTATTTTNTYVKVAGTTTATTLQKMSAPASNRLTYLGKRGITAKVMVVISGSSPVTAGAISLAIAKNGTVITAPFSSLSGMSNNQVFQLILETEVSLSTNDYVEAFIANNNGTSAITITSMQFRITD